MAMTLNFLFFKHSSAQSSEFSTSRQVPLCSRFSRGPWAQSILDTRELVTGS